MFPRSTDRFILLPSSVRQKLSLKRILDPVDLVWLTVSPFIALWLRGYGYIDPSGLPFSIPFTYQYAFITIIVSLPIFILFRLNERLKKFLTSQDALIVISFSVFSVIFSVFFIFYISRLEGIPRSVPIIYGFVLSSGLLLNRVLFSAINEINIGKISEVSNNQNYHIKRIVIIGLDQFSISALRLIKNQKPRTVDVVALFSLQGKYLGANILGTKIIGNINEIGRIIDEYAVHGILIDQVWISDSSEFYNSIINKYLQDICRDKKILYTTISGALNLSPSLIFCDDTRTIASNVVIINNPYFKLKRFLDILVALTLIILLFPLEILIILVTLIIFGLPVIFWQERVGQFGKSFRLFKFRTMGFPLDKEGNYITMMDRSNRVGDVLRRYRLDEIPQLFNIIWGTMSGIGPRPLLAVDQPEDPRLRLAVRPGLTGWAQVNGGELLSRQEKNALDCWYIHHANLFLDLLILYKTIFVFIIGTKRNEKEIEKAHYWFREKFKVGSIIN